MQQPSPVLYIAAEVVHVATRAKSATRRSAACKRPASAADGCGRRTRARRGPQAGWRQRQCCRHQRSTRAPNPSVATGRTSRCWPSTTRSTAAHTGESDTDQQRAHRHAGLQDDGDVGGRDQQQQGTDHRPVAAAELGDGQRVRNRSPAPTAAGVEVNRNLSAGVRPYSLPRNRTNTDHRLHTQNPMCSETIEKMRLRRAIC